MNEEFENASGAPEESLGEAPLTGEAPEVEAAPAAEAAPVSAAPAAETAPKKEKKHMSAGGIIAIALCCVLLGGALGLFGSRLIPAASVQPAEEVQVTAAPDSAESVAPSELPAPTEAAPMTDDGKPGDGEATVAATAGRHSGGSATAAPTEPAEPAEPTEPSDSLGEGSEAAGDDAIETSAPAAVREEMSAADVYTATVRSTVGIKTSIATTNYWGYQSTSSASGSGFILTADGYVLTNYHVIEDSSSVTVTTYDNVSYPAKVVGYDAENDIAVLKVEAEDLSPVTLGSSGTLRVGDDVIAIGNPLGELTFSLTRGVVSALNRAVTLENGTTMDLIQTDTAINSGNSGGALFNMYGEVVGITNAKYSSRSYTSSASIDNIGFAIPIDNVKSIFTSIIENGYIIKPYIGVSVGSNNSPQGAWIQSITEGSPADDSDLQVNDVVTAANGQPVASSSDLVRIVSACVPGDKLVLTVYRPSEGELEVTITVGEQQQSAVEESSSSQSGQGTQPQQGGGSYDYGFGYGFPFGYGGSDGGNSWGDRHVG